MPGRFRFVAVTDPTAPPTAEQRRAAHSHAKTQVHAKRRRQMIEKHRREQHPASLLCRAAHDYTDPFQSLAFPLTPREYALLSYYIQVAVPYAAVNCPLFSYPGNHEEDIIRDWVCLAVTDSALLSGAIFLSTCRFLLQFKPNDATLSAMIIFYKQRSLQSMRQSLAAITSVVSTLSVAKALALVVDAMSSGDVETAQKHTLGVVALVELGGGLETLKLPLILEMLCQRCLAAKVLSERGQDPVPVCGSTAEAFEILAN